MSPPRYPPYPTLPSLRLATAADLPRMARLSVLGFKDSEIFRYEHPAYEQFPEDAVAFFSNLYRSQLLDPCTIVIVAEGQRQDEDDVVDDDDCDDHDHDKHAAARIVVGVGSWVFPDGSSRTGQFVVADVPAAIPAPNRNLSQRRYDLFMHISSATEAKYLTGKMICNKLVIHPAYWSHGHGTAILRWGLKLSDLDEVDQGVIPAHMGEPLYLHLGYEVIGEMDIPAEGEGEHFTQRVAVYRTKNGKK